MAYDALYQRAIAQNYDRDYAIHRDPSGDREFYRDLALEIGGPMLELGCGTGRVLLPIAEAGVEATGLDSSPAMLDVLRARSPPPDLDLVEGDIRDFDLGERRFRLVTAPFRVLQHLETVEEQLACLGSIRRHLLPGGTLALDVFSPDALRIGQPFQPETLEITSREGDVEIRRYSTVWRDPATQVSRVRFRYERSRDGAVIGEETADISMRWYWRFELEHLLVRAGFAPVAWYGGFDRRPYDSRGEIIVVARLA